MDGITDRDYTLLNIAAQNPHTFVISTVQKYAFMSGDSTKANISSHCSSSTVGQLSFENSSIRLEMVSQLVTSARRSTKEKNTRMTRNIDFMACLVGFCMLRYIQWMYDMITSKDSMNRHAINDEHFAIT